MPSGRMGTADTGRAAGSGPGRLRRLRTPGRRARRPPDGVASYQDQIASDRSGTETRPHVAHGRHTGSNPVASTRWHPRRESHRIVSGADWIRAINRIALYRNQIAPGSAGVSAGRTRQRRTRPGPATHSAPPAAAAPRWLLGGAAAVGAVRRAAVRRCGTCWVAGHPCQQETLGTAHGADLVLGDGVPDNRELFLEAHELGQLFNGFCPEVRTGAMVLHRSQRRRQDIVQLPFLRAGGRVGGRWAENAENTFDAVGG